MCWISVILKVTLVGVNRKENEVDTLEDIMLALVRMPKGSITCEQSQQELGRERV